MNFGASSLNASSIIDLKAELQKKYESFRNLKIKQNSTQPSKRTPLINKGETVKQKKSKPDNDQPKEDEVEDADLKKSRLALEAKAKLYEEIVSNNKMIDDDMKECYLVDFQRKVLYGSKESPKDKEKDTTVNSFETQSFLRNEVNFTSVFETPKTSSSGESHNSSINETEQPVHYQNVQYNEIRDHGTSYYAFSESESKRKEQMEELNSLRQETEEQRLMKQRLQRKRKAILQARLTKICERKNIDQSVVQSYTDDLAQDEDIESTEKKKIDLSSIPLPEKELQTENKLQSEEKEPKMRPWDIGKDNLQHFISEKKIKSQTEWIEEKRDERNVEFAPPTFYGKNFRR